MTKRRIFLWLATSALAASTILYVRLNHEPYLRGTDAYYYALQAEYWAKTGEVKIPDSSFLHRVTGLLEKSGLSGESSVRLWESVSLFLFGLTGLTLLRRKPDFKNAILWFALALSPSVLFTAIEFPKLFSAFLLVPFWFAALESGFYPRTSAVLLAAASVLLHRAALPLSLAFSAAVVLRDADRPRFSLRSSAILLGTGVAAVALYFGIFHDRFHWLDLSRLSFQHAQPGLLTLFLRPSLPISIKLELALSLAAFGIFAVIRRKSDSGSAKDWLFPLALFLPALFPFGADEVLGVGERYAILVPASIWISMMFLSSKEKEEVPCNGTRAVAAVFLAVLIPLTTPLRLDLAHPRSLDPDSTSFDALVREIEPANPPMLIARKDFVFFYKFRLMREAFPYEPEDHWDKTRISRLVYAITPEELNHFLPPRCGWENGLVRSVPVAGYSLVREDCWEEMRERIVRDEEPDLYARVRETWLNPSQKRPAFLYPKHEEDSDTDFPALKKN